jgi:hypothetical protein
LLLPCSFVLSGPIQFVPQTPSFIYPVSRKRMLSRPYVEVDQVLNCVFIQVFDLGENERMQVGAGFRSRLKSRFCAVFWNMYRAVG